MESSTQEFERALKELEKGVYILRLYVTGMTPNSLRAIENIRRICREHLKGRFELEIIDIYQKPQEARQVQILAAPTLIKKLPLPIRRFIGDLSDVERILVRLDLVPIEEAGDEEKE